jgi:hypothetical protein
MDDRNNVFFVSIIFFVYILLFYFVTSYLCKIILLALIAPAAVFISIFFYFRSCSENFFVIYLILIFIKN